MVDDGEHRITVIEAGDPDGPANPYVIPRGEAEGNARLIAAAPDMLGALLVVRKALDALPVPGLGQPGTLATAADDLVQYAIAKATITGDIQPPPQIENVPRWMSDAFPGMTTATDKTEGSER